MPAMHFYDYGLGILCIVMMPIDEAYDAYWSCLLVRPFMDVDYAYDAYVAHSDAYYAYDA